MSAPLSTGAGTVAPVYLCGRCGAEATQLCARCRSTAFCDAACQRAAWRDHKPLCVPAASAATAVVPAAPFAGEKAAASEQPSSSMSIARLVELLKENIGDAGFTKRALAVLGKHSIDHRKQREMVASDAAGWIVASLRAHPASGEICFEALGVLSMLSTSPDGAYVILTSGIKDPLFAALRSLMATEDICRSAIVTLSNIIKFGSGDPDVAHLAAELASSATAFGLLATALRVHSASASVCVHACNAIVVISQTPGGERAAASASAAGAVPLVVSALRNHAKRADVCARAGSALGILCCSPSTTAVASAAGAVSLLIAVLRHHASSEDVCKSVSLTLTSFLSLRPAGREEAQVAATAIVPLLSAIRAFKSNGVLCASACDSIANVLAYNPGLGELAATGAKLILDVLDTHLASADTCQSACGAFMNICDSPVGAVAVPAVRAGSTCVAALRKHAAHPEINRCISGAIARMCMAPDAAGRAAALLAAGVVPLLVAMLRTHAANAEVVTNAVHAVGVMTCHAPCAEAAMTAGVVALLVAALRRHASNVSIVVNTSGVIKNLAATGPAAVAAITAAGAIPHLTAAVARYGPAVCRRTNDALRALGHS